MEKIIFRADASVQMGTGHVMRCLSLAEHWKNSGGEAVFVMAMNMPSLNARLESKRMDFVKLSARPGSVEDAKQTVQIAKDLSALWIILDGYDFNSSFQKVIHDSKMSLLVIDDMGSTDRYYADIVLNQNLHADKSMYVKKENYTSLLLGTSYVLLRQEFSKWHGWKRRFPENAQNILVTLGGSDEENITSKVVEAIQKIKSDKLKVVVIAPDNSHYEELESTIKRSKVDIQLKKDVIVMSDLMAWADLAVSAGGTSTWELAFMGLPMLIIAIADNQRQIVEELSKAGVAINLGWHENITLFGIAKSISELLPNANVRADMSRRAQALVDGKGADRVLAQIKRVHSRCKEENT